MGSRVLSVINYQAYQLGIFSWFGFEIPLQDRIDLIKQAGFDATTLWWEDETIYPCNKKAVMPQMVRDAGLYLENIHVPFQNCNDLWSSDKRVREEIIEYHLVWLEDCAKYRIPVMVMHVSKGSDLDSPNQYGIESMARIIEYAETLDVSIAVENTRRLDYLKRVLEEFGTGNLGICYDSSHDWLYSAEKTAILKRWGKRLISLHLSDNDGSADRHWLPGEGIVDWSKIIATLPRDFQSGCLTLEVYPKDDQKETAPEIFLKKAYQRIREIDSQLMLINQ